MAIKHTSKAYYTASQLDKNIGRVKAYNNSLYRLKIKNCHMFSSTIFTKSYFENSCTGVTPNSACPPRTVFRTRGNME